jgi:hypothetical protein
MSRTPKPNGQSKPVPVRDHRQVEQAVEQGGGAWRPAAGSHRVWQKDEHTGTYYICDEYPKGTSAKITRQLMDAGLWPLLAIPVLVGTVIGSLAFWLGW